MDQELRDMRSKLLRIRRMLSRTNQVVDAQMAGAHCDRLLAIKLDMTFNVSRTTHEDMLKQTRKFINEHQTQ